jgi:S-methylmethionine-dependent homocysteine/selenocysteine methylase
MTKQQQQREFAEQQSCESCASGCPCGRLSVILSHVRANPGAGRKPAAGVVASPATASQRWARWGELAAKFARGDKVVLDGGCGSEVEELAGPAACNDAGWSVAQNLTHPQVVKRVYRSFLDAGADVVIANTYATNQHVMDAAGLGDEFERANRVAVQLAFEARDEWAADNRGELDSGARMLPLVAGSVSCHAPGNEVDKMNGVVPWPEDEAEETRNYREQGELLVQCGVDVIVTEMLWNQEHTMRCIDGLADLQAPIWVGITCFSDNAMLARTDIRSGQAMGSEHMAPATDGDEAAARKHWPVAAAVRDMLAANKQIVGFNVHHTKLKSTLPALRAVREAGWEGPLGAYPDFGEWLRTGWKVPAPLDPAALVELAETWHRETGAQMVGGCCGIGPAHVAALRGWADSDSADAAAAAAVAAAEPFGAAGGAVGSDSSSAGGRGAEKRGRDSDRHALKRRTRASPSPPREREHDVPVQVQVQ